MTDLLKEIRRWANEKGFGEQDDILGLLPQTLKLMEESGEVAECVAKGKMGELAGEIGDIFIVITILAQQAGLSLEECARDKFNIVSKRNGRMINGVFVKDRFSSNERFI